MHPALKEQAMKWILDGTLDITAIADAAEWHRGTIVSELERMGLSHDDADAYAAFLCANHVSPARRDASPESYITDAQWDRLHVT